MNPPPQTITVLPGLAWLPFAVGCWYLMVCAITLAMYAPDLVAHSWRRYQRWRRRHNQTHRQDTIALLCNSLTHSERLVYLLHASGYRYDEIARLLGLPLSITLRAAATGQSALATLDERQTSATTPGATE